MYTPVKPSFTMYRWDVRGCTLHGYVIMIINMFSYESKCRYILMLLILVRIGES